MKNTKILTLITCLILLLQSSCRKSDTGLDVDLSNYNSDKFIYGDLDNWLDKTLTVPYNIEVVYRFDRAMGGLGRNISPPNVDRVKPTAEMVLNGFLKIYEKVAGPAFIKAQTPKQFVFFGSTVYNSNGTETLGSADGGRKVVLYNLNTLDEYDATSIKRRLRTIHHEFTHILNQTVDIPPTFEKVTPADYTGDWSNAANSESLAQNLGFISRYARDQYTEDFAETVAFLLVEGQLYYNRYAAAAGETGFAKLKQKEAIVVDYFKQYFNIDFRKLQYEMALVLKTLYNDPTETFYNQLQKSYVNQIDVDLIQGAHYANYGESATFNAVWSDIVEKIALKIGNSSGRSAKSFSLVFKENEIQLQAFFGRNPTTSTISEAFYDFKIEFLANGNLKFVYVPNTAEDTEYNNGRELQSGWQPLLDYLSNNEFVPDWIPTSAGLYNYMQFAGFTVVGSPDNYFYGPIIFN